MVYLFIFLLNYKCIHVLKLGWEDGKFVENMLSWNLGYRYIQNILLCIQSDLNCCKCALCICLGGNSNLNWNEQYMYLHSQCVHLFFIEKSHSQSVNFYVCHKFLHFIEFSYEWIKMKTIFKSKMYYLLFMWPKCLSRYVNQTVFLLFVSMAII